MVAVIVVAFGSTFAVQFELGSVGFRFVFIHQWSHCQHSRLLVWDLRLLVHERILLSIEYVPYECFWFGWVARRLWYNIF